ncbi:MAG: histidine--tRNA ligase [Alphaproteobacteria bacterium]|nr:histidine--tRNA ligase [Alphaproteobacteria bacterium]
MSENIKRIYKPKAISGFPEWLPEERLVEQKWFDHIRRVFESYGFCSIETPSVEEIDVLLAKGEVDKEIYALERLHKDEHDKGESRLALHFDQTVPLARYVAQHFNELTFPFKRYQMQRVWRGERPQMGRMREFYQCDIDVIHVDNLPISFDAEVAAIMYEVLEGLNIGRAQLRINNRKILTGLLETMNIRDITPVTRAVDKLEKIGDFLVIAELRQAGLNEAQSQKVLNLAQQKGTAADIKRISCENATMTQGAEELVYVLDHLAHLPAHGVIADLSIVRGLDYYTGTVYETKLLDVPEFTGSVCSGGRYDDLAGSYINKHLPGVGISLGFSRLFDVIRQTRPELMGIGPKGPAEILMVIPDENKRALASETARTLRRRGFKVEMYHAAQKIKKQLEYASKKLIPFVWFPPFEDGKPHEVKNMSTGEQITSTPETWKA